MSRDQSLYLAHRMKRLAGTFAMNRPVLVIVVLLEFTAAHASAQNVQSPYLANPDLAIGYVDSCAAFWFKAYDSVQGGFYMNIDRTGNLITSWGTGKNPLNESRDAYGFLRAYMLTGNVRYLTYARRALDFLYRSGWDNTNGGWYSEVNKSGSPTNASANKTAYYQHYAILGILASVEVTDDSVDRAILTRSLAHNEAHFWDARAQSFGYYDQTLANGTSPSGKSFNATVDAITTHLLTLYLMTGDSTYWNRLVQVADNMVNRLAASAASQATGFVEAYDTNWNPDPSQTMTIMGHVLKTAWCLARMYQLHPDPGYLSTAEQLVDIVLQKGYDHQNGGPYKDYDRTTGQMLMWGQADTAKAWWQMEQAVTAGLMLNFITGKSKYLTMADETLTFFMKYFVDHLYGEVYENRTKYGAQIWDTNKGDNGKAAYHSIELGYYTYLYGKLLLKHQSATLHYAFTPVGRFRDISLTPIAAPAGFLRILDVTLDGIPYANVDKVHRILHIPLLTGGDFAVTFAPTSPDAVEQPVAGLPEETALDQNYPNPFNPTTKIGFRVSGLGSSWVKLSVYDILGREVAVLVDGPRTPGTHFAEFNARGLASGVYLYRLSVSGIGTQLVETKRMIMVK
jgi:mannose/cellobiose epimerase-like protein (N-acyl-D-glucosamine 2-epimerase family)